MDVLQFVHLSVSAPIIPAVPERLLLITDINIIKKPCRSMVQKYALKVKIMANRINDAKSWSHSLVNVI
ncbi:hypothetical protein CKG00_08410 [Morganella morganii]|uniref:Uncharacterized protein n=1 Tax=Morganella morganii TaxID=582 RepID=A0A433ZWC5_MORMO|nr:hypothetical protein CKG00_08410 [Morganella morganii]